MNISRRQLAIHVADELAQGVSARKLARQMAAHLAANHQLGQSELVLKDIALALQRRHGVVSAEVSSRYPLTDELRRALKAALADKTGAKRVNLRESTDESLLGGLVATTPELELDLSVRGRLNAMARES